MRPTWTTPALKVTITAAHFIIGKLVTYFTEHHMNLSDRLKQFGTAIEAGAPHLAAIASEAETVVAALAPAVIAAVPGTGAANVAAELSAATAAASAVANTVVGVLAPAPAVDPVPVATAQPTPGPEVAPISEAASAASSVSASATATPSSLEARIALLESAVSEALPALASVLKLFGK